MPLCLLCLFQPQAKKKKLSLPLCLLFQPQAKKKQLPLSWHGFEPAAFLRLLEIPVSNTPQSSCLPIPVSNTTQSSCLRRDPCRQHARRQVTVRQFRVFTVPDADCRVNGSLDCLSRDRRHCRQHVNAHGPTHRLGRVRAAVRSAVPAQLSDAPADAHAVSAAVTRPGPPPPAHWQGCGIVVRGDERRSGASKIEAPRVWGAQGLRPPSV